MKIPDTSANVGAYYGNEENGQWQPNGVIIDSGVGGGVVGSGDAGIHRPPLYPVHLPRSHIPAGYVVAGPYYQPAPYPPIPPAPQDDFADYMWMENEEEFDKQVMQQLEEEALMEQCIEAMLEDEQRERQRPVNGHNNQQTYPTTSNGNASLSLEETVSRSTLNPLAAEFVPTRARPPTNTPPEEKQESTEANSQQETQNNAEETPPSAQNSALNSAQNSAQDTAQDTVQNAQNTEQSDTTTQEDTEVHKTDPTPSPTDPPEVSAADIQTTDKRPKDKREVKPKVDTKKPVATKQEKPKVKPQPVKSEIKVVAKKKEVKTVKSEVKVDEKIEDSGVGEVPQPTPVEESTPITPGLKPINYAAAAKANKPKKPTTPPAMDKTTPPPFKTEKKDLKEKKEKTPVQRKNSTK